MAEDALLIERDTSRRFQISIYARSCCDAGVLRSNAREARFELRHRPREGIAQTGNELKQRQVAIAGPASQEIAVTLQIALDHPSEITETFRDEGGDES